MDRNELINELTRYQTGFPEERRFAVQILTLLQHPRAYYRDHLPGHMTGSAWITNESRTKVVLLHHAKLDRWLQPGGHADGDENILAVARREAHEETGLTRLTLCKPGIFDIDIHSIPQRQDFPRHDHYDIRFVFEVQDDENLQVSEESKDLAWIPLRNLASYTKSNDSILRMATKTMTSL